MRGGTDQLLEGTLDETPTDLKINLPRIRAAIATPQAHTPILIRTIRVRSH